MTSLITVIVPVYNTKYLLKRCVESICNQSYSELEIFLIDDGSTDGSGDLCDSFAVKDRRIHVIHQKNSGQGAARNQALDQMHGEYVYFVDSDDYILPDAIETMLNAMIDNNCDMCICGVINDHIFTKKECPKQETKIIYNKEKLFISYLTEPYIRGTLCNKFYKKELFDGLRFSTIRAREDVDILYKVYSKIEKAIYIPDALYIQFIRPGSTEQGNFNEAKLYTITIYEKMAKYISSNIKSISEYTELVKAKACRDVLNAIAQDPNRNKWMDVYEKVEKQLQEEINIHKEHADVVDKLYCELEKTAFDRAIVMKNGRKMRLKNMILCWAKKMLYPFYKRQFDL